MRVAALLLLGFLAIGCNEDKPRCVATMEAKVFFECSINAHSEDSIFEDPSTGLTLMVPINWQLIENKNANPSWVLFDTSRVFSQGSALAIVLKNSELTLKEYFYKEIDHADLDSNLAVIRAGRDQLGDHFCYWFQMERHQEKMPPQHSIMYYTDGMAGQKIVIDALVYGTDRMDERFCRLKRIANTVKVDQSELDLLPTK